MIRAPASVGGFSPPQVGVSLAALPREAQRALVDRAMGEFLAAGGTVRHLRTPCCDPTPWPREMPRPPVRTVTALELRAVRRLRDRGAHVPEFFPLLAALAGNEVSQAANILPQRPARNRRRLPRSASESAPLSASTAPADAPKPATNRAASLRDLAERLRSGDADAAAMAADALEAVVAGGAGSLDEAFGFRCARGSRKPSTQEADALRNHAIRQAARRFCPGKSNLAAAEFLARRLEFYRQGDWLSDRLAPECPFPDETLRGHLWRILKGRDAALSPERIRRILALVTSGRGMTSESCTQGRATIGVGGTHAAD